MRKYPRSKSRNWLSGSVWLAQLTGVWALIGTAHLFLRPGWSAWTFLLDLAGVLLALRTGADLRKGGWL